MFLKKGKKQPVNLFSELLVKLITGWIFRSLYPATASSRE